MSWENIGEPENCSQCDRKGHGVTCGECRGVATERLRIGRILLSFARENPDAVFTCKAILDLIANGDEFPAQDPKMGPQR